MAMKDPKNINFTIPKQLIADCRIAAQEEERSVAQLIRMAIQKYINDRNILKSLNEKHTPSLRIKKVGV